MTDAQRRARDKWLDKQDDIKLRVPKGQKEIIKCYAEKCGESLNAFLYRVVKEEMERNPK